MPLQNMLPMNKLVCILLLLLAKSYGVYSQQFAFSKEIKFSNSLLNKEQFEDALFVLNGIDASNISAAQKDSLCYEKAWLFYTKKKLDSAIFYFNKISENNARKTKADFFKAYCLAFLKQVTQGENTLNNLAASDTVYTQLKNFELAGLALLQKNYAAFDKYAANFTYSNYAFNNEEKLLVDTKKMMFTHKKKSPFLAATLSAIIPGLGKIYAGKKKEGIGAFIPIVSSGLLALEGYNKGGLKDARFLIFGTLFTTFYIGNIWGSSLSVKISESEFNTKNENKILFNLHIPLRSIFN